MSKKFTFAVSSADNKIVYIGNGAIPPEEIALDGDNIVITQDIEDDRPRPDHYEYNPDNGTITKKSDEDIATMEAEKDAVNPAKIKNKKIKAQSKIINDNSKTDGEKLAAVISVLKERGIIIEEE